MAVSLDSYLSSYYAYSSTSQMSLLSQMLGSAKETAQSYADTYLKNNETVKTLKSESANFLKQYINGMNGMYASANKLAGGGIKNLLYDRQGNVTDDTVKKTVDAVKDMVTAYNANLKLLNDNADRGPGVMSQMARMVQDPAPQEGMEMVGMSVNDDGTLALDEEKLTAALKTEDVNQRKLYEDIIGGYAGIADNVRGDARAGLDTAPSKLIAGDLAKIQNIRDEDPIRSYYREVRAGGAYALNNAAAMGILMNMLA